MASYNLVEEKWIPCIKEGQHCEYGLYEVLTRAHEITEIYDPSPLVTLSLHRLLLAILHRNFGPQNLEKWKELWAQGMWDAGKLTCYFEKWKHRFDLFDELRPFYQVPEAKLKKAIKHPVTRLALELSSGHNATLFDHSYDAAPQLVHPSLAARHLIALQAFAIGLGKSYPFYFSDAPLTRGIIVFIQGDNLFQTLLLNMVPYTDYEPFPIVGQDLPIWERDQLPQPDRKGSPITGYLDYLTWQSRAVYLFPDADGASVRYCLIQQNLKLPDAPYFDPMKCYRRDAKRGWVPLPVREDRTLWRDSHALLQTSSQPMDTKRPGVLDFLARIEQEKSGRLVRASTAYRLNVIGLASEARKPAKVTLWRHERLPLPTKYLENEELVAALKKALDLAENVGNVLDQATKRLAELLIAPEGKSLNEQQQKKDTENLVQHFSAAPFYWARLGISFPQLVTQLANDVTQDGDLVRYGDHAIPWWAQEARRVAEEAFRSITSSLDNSTRALRASTQAVAEFQRRLAYDLSTY